MSEKCRLGYVEHDGYRYCFAHGQFVHEYGPHPLRCDGATVEAKKSGDVLRGSRYATDPEDQS